jgi:hypothetical protein
MTRVTDEMVEIGAKAIWEAYHPNPPGWVAWGDKSEWGPNSLQRERTLKASRAALEAALAVETQLETQSKATKKSETAMAPGEN